MSSMWWSRCDWSHECHWQNECQKKMHANHSHGNKARHEHVYIYRFTRDASLVNGWQLLLHTFSSIVCGMAHIRAIVFMPGKIRMQFNNANRLSRSITLTNNEAFAVAWVFQLLISVQPLFSLVNHPFSLSRSLSSSRLLRWWKEYYSHNRFLFSYLFISKETVIFFCSLWLIFQVLKYGVSNTSDTFFYMLTQKQL